MNTVLAGIAQSKAVIEMLLNTEDYNLQEFAESWRNYQSYLEAFCDQATEADREVLESELNWVKDRQLQVAKERQRIAGTLIKLQNGRKVTQRYGNS
jgi:hypothetical protein